MYRGIKCPGIVIAGYIGYYHGHVVIVSTGFEGKVDEKYICYACAQVLAAAGIRAVKIGMPHYVPDTDRVDLVHMHLVIVDPFEYIFLPVYDETGSYGFAIGDKINPLVFYIGYGTIYLMYQEVFQRFIFIIIFCDGEIVFGVAKIGIGIAIAQGCGPVVVGNHYFLQQGSIFLSKRLPAQGL